MDASMAIEAVRLYHDHAENFCDCPGPPPFACETSMSEALDALSVCERERNDYRTRYLALLADGLIAIERDQGYLSELREQLQF